MISDVNLLNIDEKVGKSVLEAIDIITKKYPVLLDMINVIGPISYVQERKCIATKKIYNQKTKNNKKDLYSHTLFCISCGYLQDKNTFTDKMPFFIGIGINEKNSYKDILLVLEEYQKNNSSYCKNIKDCIYHEIGHALERILLLNKSTTFREMVKNYMQTNYEDYPSYALSSEKEFVAECFAKYITDPNYNNAVRNIGYVIDSMYNYIFNQKNIKYNTNEIYIERILKITV